MYKLVPIAEVTLVFLLLVLPAANGQNCHVPNKKPNVALIIPTNVEHSFFNRVEQISKASSAQLNINLTIFHYDEQQYNRFYYADYIDKILSQNKRFNYLISMFFTRTEAQVLNVVNKHKVYLFSFNSPLSSSVKKSIGVPRQKSPYWLGHLSPNDVKVGYDVATKLFRESADTPLTLLAITGSRNSEVASQRTKGLYKSLAENKHITLLQILHTDWSYQDGRNKTAMLLKRYKDVDLFWSASDTLSRAIFDEVALTRTKQLEKNKLIGIDWSPQIIPYIQHQQVQSSYGGHIFETAWILGLIHDHHNNYDFVNELGSTIQHSLMPITKDLTEYLTKTNTLNFKTLSKCLSNSKQAYKFDAIKLLTSQQQKEK